MTAPVSNRARPQQPQPRQPAPAPQPAPRRPTDSAQGRAQSLLQQGRSFYEANRAEINGLGRAGGRAMTQVNLSRDGFRARNNPNAAFLRPTGAGPSRPGMGQRLLERAGIPRSAQRLRTLANPYVGAGRAALRLPGQTLTAARDVRTALRTGNAGDVDRAARSTRTALDGGRAIAELAPGMRYSRTVLNRLTAQSPRAAQLMQRVSRPAQRLVESSAGRMVTRLAARPALTTTARVGARAAGRFVPGANVAIAAIDARDAYRALRDPNAGFGRRTTAVITALGSGLAATNIPGFSQAGAAVSTVSDAIGAFFR